MDVMRLGLAGIVSAFAISGVLLAQDDGGWAPVSEHDIDGCAAMSGVALYDYQDIDVHGVGTNTYILSQVCFDEAAGTLDGFETIDGLVPAHDYGPFSVGLEAVADSDRSSGRRSLTTSPLFRPEAEMPLPPDLVTSFNARVLWRLISGLEGREELQIHGYLSAPEAVLDETDLAEGLWVLSISPNYDGRLAGETGAEPDGNAFQGGEEQFLFRVTDGQMVQLGGVIGQEPAAFDITLAGDQIEGTTLLTATNPTLEAAREANAFETATMELRTFRSQAVMAEDGPLILGLGVGRTVFVGPGGATNVEDAWARFELQSVPPQFPEDEVRGYFGVEPFVVQ